MGESFWQKESLLQYTMTLLQDPKILFCPPKSTTLESSSLPTYLTYAFRAQLKVDLNKN